MKQNRYKILTKIINLADKLTDIIVYLCIICTLAYGAFGLYDTYCVYSNSGKNAEIVKYKPKSEEVNEISKENKEDNSFKELMEVNKDICGWLTVDGTNIDYPILQGEDNSKYINRDYEGEYSVVGSVFLDYRNQNNFNDFYSLLYAHSMAGDNMFGKIPHYLKKEFFLNNSKGTLFDGKLMHNITIFASVYTDAYNKVFYNPQSVTEPKEKEKLISYIKSNATHFRDIEITKDDHIIGMSTCSSRSVNGRVIVFAKLDPVLEEVKE